MRISDDRLEELRRIYKTEIGEEISLAEVSEMAYRLVFLYQIIGRPLPDELSSPGPGGR